MYGRGGGVLRGRLFSKQKEWHEKMQEGTGGWSLSLQVVPGDGMGREWPCENRLGERKAEAEGGKRPVPRRR